MTKAPIRASRHARGHLEGKDKELLIALVRKILRWLLEERPSAEDLFEDEFLIQWTSKEKGDPE